MQHCNEERQSQPMIVSISSSAGCGTGFFVRDNLIATNIHCIAGASLVKAKLLDRSNEYIVEGVVAFDDRNDLVVLKVSDVGTPFSIGNSDMIKKGEPVKAMGCIDGNYVEAKGEYHSSVNNGQWLQTTAKTINGYSGGPLLDSKGLVIGINFVSRDYCSDAISSNILKELVYQTRAIESLDQWQKRKKICAYGFVVQSKNKIEGKEYANAIIDLDEAIQLNPDIINNYYNRGNLKIQLAQSRSEEGNFIEAQELMKSAIIDFTQAINYCPDYFRAYNNRADARLQLGKIEAKKDDVKSTHDLYQDALTDVNIAINEYKNTPIEEDPEVAICYHTLGEIKEAMGDLSGAKNDFEKAITNSEYNNDSTLSDDLKRVKDKLKQQE